MAVELGAVGGPTQPPPIALISDTTKEAQKASGVNVLRIDGKSFPLRGSLTWGFKSGVAPQSVAVQMQKRFANAFAKKAKKNKLTIEIIVNQLNGGTGEDTNHKKHDIKFQKLTMQYRPPSDYARDMIVIKDDRDRWDKEKVFRDFNIARKVNDIIIFKQLPASRQNLLRDASVYYRERTLNPDTGLAWTALQVIQYILEELLGYDKKDINIDEANRTDYIPQNEMIDGEGCGSVINRMLTLEGNDLYLDEQGRVVIQDRTRPMSVKDFANLFPNGITGRTRGAMHLMDYSAIRPQSIEHHLTPKIELLCTHKQTSDATVVDEVARNFADAEQQMRGGRVFVENVTRTVIDGQAVDANGEDLPRGTVITIEESLKGFGNLYGTNQMTVEDLTQFYGADAFLITGAALQAIGTNVQGGTNSTDYIIDPTAAVVKDGIEKDFRTLFRLPRFIIELIRGMEALHADILNPVNRTRAPSSVFSTISWLVPSSVSLPKSIPDGVVLDSFTARDSKSGKVSQRDKYVPLSGAKVIIEDEDLGLVRIDWGQDYDRPGAVKSVIPGEANDEGYYIRSDTNYSYNDRSSFSGTGIKNNWECSFVISVIPDLFTDGKRNYREVRGPARMKSPTGQTVRPKGRGPRIQRRIRLDSARFTHGIARYELGPIDPTQNPSAKEVGAFGRYVNEAVITALIDAENERMYKTFNDQIEGSMVVKMGKQSVKIRPTGGLRTVLYTYSENGNVDLTLIANRYETPKSILSLLPADVLRATVRQLEPPPQGG